MRKKPYVLFVCAYLRDCPSSPSRLQRCLGQGVCFWWHCHHGHGRPGRSVLGRRPWKFERPHLHEELFPDGMEVKDLVCGIALDRTSVELWHPLCRISTVSAATASSSALCHSYHSWSTVGLRICWTWSWRLTWSSACRCKSFACLATATSTQR